MKSLLDPELEITQTAWMVSLLRKPAGKNPEHAFILVEGSQERNRVLFRRYDLLLQENSKTAYDVHVKEKDTAESLGRKTLLNEILNHDEVFGKNWQINASKAEELHELVQEAQEDPNHAYNILGNVASVPKTAPNSDEKTINNLSSGNAVSGLLAHGVFAQSGHNCFTWSRAMLRQLNVDHITRSLPTKPEELIVSMTSRLLAEQANTVSKSVSQFVSSRP